MHNPATPAPTFEFTGSRQFTAWLGEQQASLAFTTYQAGKLFLIGLNLEGRLSVFERTFERCMGLCAAGDQLYMSTLYQLWRFDNALPPAEIYQGYDRLYVPQLAYTTGDLDIHDIALGRDGKPIFANTLFSCIATVSEGHSFKPVWKPFFIGKLAAEDRCHLNGLAAEDGAPRYVTCVSQSDAADGWRDKRAGGGIVVDAQRNEVVLDGLSMPHSPRLYRGKLWLLDSGSGYFGYADLERGRFEPVAFCPGFLRGLAFVGDYAIIGLSKARQNRTFTGLPLDGNLQAKNTDARCALHIVDLRSGDSVHWLRIDGVVEELYDVVVLPGARRPMALGFRTDEIRRMITLEPGAGEWGK
ncbi:MAG: TIGR03032 family protein [Gammaproteobacteria bacterium]